MAMSGTKDGDRRCRSVCDDGGRCVNGMAIVSIA